MCLADDEETTNHLLVHCSFVTSLDNSFSQVWGAASDLFQQWKITSKLVRQKIMWKLSLFAVFWKLWLERKNKLFRGTKIEVDVVMELAFWIVSSWAS